MNRSILINRVLQAAVNHPEHPALRFSNEEYSYRELLEIAAAFSRTILDQHDEAPVIAILAQRSLTAYAGILGILLSGKGYLPLNPDFPPQRNAFILNKSKASTIVVGKESAQGLEEILRSAGRSFNIIALDPISNGFNEEIIEIENIQEPDLDEVQGDPESIAYLLFTSGSTGMPKGVAVSNQNVTAYLDHISSLFAFTPQDRFTQTFDLTFDLSVHDLFVCWTAGACLCIPDDNSSFALNSYLKAMQPTVWFSVPSAALLMDRMRLLKEGAFPWLRLSFFCGEALLDETALSWKKAAPGSQLVNLYGPTEATIAVTSYEIPGDVSGIKTKNGIVSMGKLFPGHTYLIQGEEGLHRTMLLSGPQVVKGYYEDDILTAQYFSEKGTPPQWFYNTGDLVEADKEGDLFFLGRADSEVKISGYRVNLLEIDHVINAHDQVKQAVTLYLKGNENNFVLVSFIVRYEEKDVISSVTEHCRSRLPKYMVPEKIIFVNELPLNPNGKTDRRALAKYFLEYHG